ncbi:MAG: CHAT domain-containing protein [Crocinitomix sp.]|nr:CHAT domain-containing protein [Crocinitomix sp.]
MFKIYPIVLFLYFCLSSFYASANQLDSLLNTLSEIPEDRTSENLDEKSILCNSIAICYQNISEDNKARAYFLQSIAFTEERIELENDWNDQNCYDIGYLYRNMATFESTTGNSEQALKYIDKSEVYYTRLKALLSEADYNAIMVEFYTSNFTLAYHLGDYDKGLSHLLKVEKMLLSSSGKSMKLAENYRYRAELSLAIQDYEQSEVYAQKALELYDEFAPKNRAKEASFVHSFLSSKFHFKKYEEIIEFLDQRVGYRSTEEAIETVAENQGIYLGSFVDNMFIRSYTNMRQYQQTKNLDLILEADRWQQAGFQIAEDYIVKNNADKIGNIISNPENKVLGSLICLGYLKEGEQLADDKIVEAMRMIDVHQSARLHVERVSYQVNKELSQKEKKLKNELIYVNLKLEEAVRQDSSIANKDSLSDLAFTLSSEIQELNKLTKHDKILAEYQIGQKQFKDLLNTFLERTNKNVVTYFYEAKVDSVYIIGANKNSVYFKAAAVPKNFKALIKESYQLNAHLQSNPSGIDRQFELNKALYSYLIQPILPHLNSKELLVYPNNEISYVSFDALIDGDDKYLVETYAVQYTSSLFSIINEKNEQQTNPSFASFYPANYGTNKLAYLNNGKQEVNDIQVIMGGKSFIGKAASKLNFLDLSNQKQILHLASHSVLNVVRPYESYILFDKTTDTTENRLFAHEIFSKTLSCDMVTLSSCNSASGEIEEGIGVVSLANAFYFAGVPSTVSSLWSAQDKSSAKIMVDFYANLKLGLGKSESLQRAKIEYIKEADKVRMQPFFWANYVVYGNDAALFERGVSVSWWKYLFGTGLVIVLLILGRKLF